MCAYKCYKMGSNFTSEIIFSLVILMLSHTASSNISETLNLCSCADQTDCPLPQTVPLVEHSQSRNIHNLNTKLFQTVNVTQIVCKADENFISLSEGNFALLPNMNLVHLHSQVEISNSNYCFRTYSRQEYSAQRTHATRIVLEAEVCLPAPILYRCCEKGKTMVQAGESEFECKDFDSNPGLPRVKFDGKFQYFLFEESVKRPSSCITKIVPISDASGFGEINLKYTGLELRWTPYGDHRMIRIANTNYCVGQIDSPYGHPKSVAAFCVDTINENTCKNDTEACFVKCCPEDSMYDMDKHKCQYSSAKYTWMPDSTVSGNFSLVLGEPECSSFFRLDGGHSHDDNFQLQSNGNLFINFWNKTIPPDSYCVDLFYNSTHLTPQAYVCSQKKEQIVHEEVSPVCYVVMLLASSVQLLIMLTIFIFKIIKRYPMISNKPFYLASMVCLVSYTVLSSIMLALQQILYKSLSSVGCVLLSTLYHWFSLASLVQLTLLVIEQYSHWCHGTIQGTWKFLAFLPVPAILSGLITLLAHMVTNGHSTGAEYEPPCTIDAAMLDPWASYPITAAYFIFLATTGVVLTLHALYYWRTDKASTHLPNGSSPCVTCESYRTNVDTIDKLWLNVILTVVFLYYGLSYIAVWGSEQEAFWVYVDLSVFLRTQAMFMALLRQMTYKPPAASDSTDCHETLHLNEQPPQP